MIILNSDKNKKKDFIKNQKNIFYLLYTIMRKRKKYIQSKFKIIGFEVIIKYY